MAMAAIFNLMNTFETWTTLVPLVSLAFLVENRGRIQCGLVVTVMYITCIQVVWGQYCTVGIHLVQQVSRVCLYIYIRSS